MKVLRILESKEVTIKNNTFLVEIKKVTQVKKVRSADPRAGNYTDRNYVSDVTFVNGENYMGCSCIDLAIDELKHGGYKFFTK